MVKMYVGNGQYCYTRNCKRHSKVIAFRARMGKVSPAMVDVYANVVNLVERDHPDLKDYYVGTDKKHFSDPDSPGSKFTDPKVKNIEALLTLTALQRGGLAGDDREKLIALGADPEAFQEETRYLLVETPGKLGVAESRFLPDDTVLKVERTKPLAPCSWVAEVEKQPTVNYGVVVISDYLGKERFITAFPGAPTRISKSKESADRMNSLEGEQFTVAEARAMLGREFNVHTRIV